MVGIDPVELLHSLKPKMDKLTEISSEVGCNGYYVFTLNPGADILVHGRMFAPAIGIMEDPVTGNANVPLGAYLVHFGICRQLEHENELRYTIKQGEVIKRDSGMIVQVGIKGNKPMKVKITGQAVVAFRTEIEV